MNGLTVMTHDHAILIAPAGHNVVLALFSYNTNTLPHFSQTVVRESGPTCSLGPGKTSALSFGSQPETFGNHRSTVITSSN